MLFFYCWSVAYSAPGYCGFACTILLYCQIMPGWIRAYITVEQDFLSNHSMAHTVILPGNLTSRRLKILLESTLCAQNCCRYPVSSQVWGISQCAFIGKASCVSVHIKCRFSLCFWSQQVITEKAGSLYHAVDCIRTHLYLPLVHSIPNPFSTMRCPQ